MLHHVHVMSHDVHVMQHDVSVLHHDVHAMQHDVGVMQHDVGVMQHEVALPYTRVVYAERARAPIDPHRNPASISALRSGPVVDAPVRAMTRRL
jgi:hypothetical protein